MIKFSVFSGIHESEVISRLNAANLNILDWRMIERNGQICIVVRHEA